MYILYTLQTESEIGKETTGIVTRKYVHILHVMSGNNIGLLHWTRHFTVHSACILVYMGIRCLCQSFEEGFFPPVCIVIS